MTVELLMFKHSAALLAEGYKVVRPVSISVISTGIAVLVPASILARVSAYTLHLSLFLATLSKLSISWFD